MSARLVLRSSRADDADGVRALAERDSQPVPVAPLIVAESDGRLLAALSLASGQVIADPFEPTAHLVAALQAHAAAPQEEGSDAWKRERPCAQVLAAASGAAFGER
jgi:CheY-like chemotaxis protein